MLHHRSLLLCAIISVFLCPTAAWSQEPPKQDAPKPQPKQNLVKMYRSEMVQNGSRRALQGVLRSQWEGASGFMILGTLNNEGVRKGLNISDEQYAEMKSVPARLGELLQKHPEFVSIQAELQKIQKLDDPMMQNADAETKKKLSGLQNEIVQLVQDIANEEINKSITPEQKTKYQEFQLATMSENPFVSAKMFESLDLSDEQKQKMSAVQKELEPSFNQFSDDFIKAAMAAQDKLFERLERDNPVIEDAKELQEKIQGVTKDFEKDEDMLKLQKKIMESGQSFAVKVRYQMFDVLTDAQMAKLQDLLDNPPDYVKQFIADAKKTREAVNPADPQSFMNSWKPGDGPTKEYLERRKKEMEGQPQGRKDGRSFPRSEKKE